MGNVFEPHSPVETRNLSPSKIFETPSASM